MALITRIGSVTISIPQRSSDDPGPTQRNLLRNFSGLIPLGGLFTAIYYGLYLVWATRFTSPFGLNPEEIGITPTWILFRSPYLATSALAPILVLWALHQARTRLGKFASFALHLLAALVFVSYLVIGVGSYVAIGIDGFTLSDGLWVTSQCALIASISAAVSWWYQPSPRIFVLCVIAGVVLVLSGVLYAWDGGARAADQLGHGQLGELRVGPVTFLSIERVQVFQLSSPEGLEGDLPECGILMGEANGITVLLSESSNGVRAVWRLPIDQTALRQGCI